MSNYLKLNDGVPRATAVQGTDIGSGSATSNEFLAANGSGGSAFRILTSSDLPTITLTSDVTGSGSGGSIATTVSAIQGTSVTGTTGTGKVVFQTSPTINGAAIDGSGTTIQTFANFVDVTDATKTLQISTSGSTTNTKLTLATQQSTSEILQIPNITATDTIATLGLAQTFSGANTFSHTGTALTVTNGATVGTLTLTNALTVPNGGTGVQSIPAYAVIVGGTTSTSAIQTPIAGTVGQVLTYQGTAALPTWTTPAASGVTSFSFTNQDNVTGTVTNSTTTPTLALAPTSPAPAATSFASWDANKNLSANSVIEGVAVTATAAGTTTLTVSSAENQVFTGSSTQIVVLPNATTLGVGQSFKIYNQSSGALTLEFNGGAAFTDAFGINYSLVAAHTAIELTLQTNGTSAGTWAVLALPGAGLGAPGPTVQKFLSSSGTYTTPANVSFITVQMVGGGGGGGGTQSGQTAGGTGGNTTFGTSLLVANGGGGGSITIVNSGAGGTSSLGSGPIGIALPGGTGTSGFSDGSGNYAAGGTGASTPLGGGGGGAGGAIAGQSAAANTGAGGGGSGTGSGGGASGGGGSAGGYVFATITNPLATYSYAVGTAGSAGGGVLPGGAGGSGVIIVTEYYFNGLGASAGNGGAYTPTVSDALNSGAATGTGAFVSGNYTTPANVSYIVVEGVGGGGGASGSGSATGGTGSTGGITTFGTSLLTANGGVGGVWTGSANSGGGLGGTASVTTSSSVLKLTAVSGGQGGAGTVETAGQVSGGFGGNNPLGGGGAPGVGAGNPGNAGVTNTGAGGGGAGANIATAIGGAGGGAGGYFKALIIPTAGQVFAYSVGAVGGGGSAGTSGQLGGAGGLGAIRVTEYYNNGAVGTATNVTGIVAVANGGTGLTSVNYYSGYMSGASSWSTTSTSFADGTNLGGNTLTSRFSNGMTVTAAASSVAGLTFTPTSSTAVYYIKAKFLSNGSAINVDSSYRLVDSSGVVVDTGGFQQATASSALPLTLEGIYAPGTGSAVTVKIQIATSTGTAFIQNNNQSIVNTIEWSIRQIQ